MTLVMTDFPFDIVGFDLDGTLVDTSGDLANALNHALADAGRGVEAAPMRGRGRPRKDSGKPRGNE